MKKFNLLVSIWLFSCMELPAQGSTELSLYFAPARAFANIESRDNSFDEYVHDRNENEPSRGGVILGISLEKPITRSLQYQTGLSFAFYGLRPTRLNTSDLHTENNPDRLSYVGRQEYYFITVPFNVKKDIFQFGSKPGKEGTEIDFTVYVIGGGAGSYMFRSMFERRYELQVGGEEITENEFENSFDTNPFNIVGQAGLGFQIQVNQKWNVILQPTLSHNLFSLYKNGISERLTVFSTKIGVGLNL